MKKLYLSIPLFLIQLTAFGQQFDSLSVEKIMRDPKWIGVSPSAVFWSDDSQSVYFNWNPDKTKSDSLYVVEVSNRKINKVATPVRMGLARNGAYNKDRSLKVVEKYGDIYLYDLKNGSFRQLTNTVEQEFLPVFSGNGDQVIFRRADNLFSLSLNSGSLTQLTNFLKGTKIRDAHVNDQDKWLKEDQLAEFEILKERKAAREGAQKARKKEQFKRLREIYLEGKSVTNLRISPDGNFVTYNMTVDEEARNTIVPNYVTESGYTEDIPTRSKVGGIQPLSEFYVYDRLRDTILSVSTLQIPGIYDLPDYLKDYPFEKKLREKKKEAREVTFYGPYWSEDGKNAIVSVFSTDNKDRWIFSLNVVDGKLKLIDRQRDEAWIGGPGIDRYGENIGWINNQTVYYQSEATGYSHLYTYQVADGKKNILTTGNWEVQSVKLSNDKRSFYITANKEHPGTKDFYRLSVNGGAFEKLTSMKGANEVSLSPDEKWLAIRYSYSNKPWELYLQENKSGGEPQQLTQSTSEEFKSYKWREPEVISFKGRTGEVYARLYQPSKPHTNKPAVIFVHGAGYLQNAHYWWSQYFREYMFHNLLIDKGYTVLDIDYQASAGYGRRCRTNIYRHMGGADLNDQVDGAKLLVDKYGVNPKAIGIYGGSYGGFITLMAMFTQPEVFKAGAALRSVTDWAHYNHDYTANILNEPINDSIAYKRSSPIYFAEGLKGKLLMCHGMVDVNVHFQDIVRLSQRLIELGKSNWELAVYPMEDHGFVEPSSWTDEYKRIFKLFEQELKH
ncbi:prolyl oligopeptidase family serine peptidase [Solitalea lacus]|uniref:prolyl oligopeptidase family serine peptidase n=1 Tax=Solitalea lacus TaxID=2911172 RepID=UPI001EDC38CC|nr:prolyl oligopeptidase family serine peptidase [Solitalea lacus]UKJ08106.1 prolyl oligopeptidase family serine peptidase [Solitalea lacus]